MDIFIKNYKILREIGKSGMGIVYKAMNIETQKTFAIKAFPASIVDRSMVERFTAGEQAMARLRHPNLVAVSDFGMTEGWHFYVMEFVDGETLRSIIKQTGALPLEDALKIILKTAGALSYIHTEGIIHRDIKPGNIMVTHEGLVKLMDCGLVKIPGITKVAGSGPTAGTTEYMSPEQIYGEEMDTKSDIYSLGVTMYEMLSGDTLFKADTLQGTLMKHKHETLLPLRSINPSVPEEIERIIMKASNKDAAARYQRMQELIDDINKFKGKKSKSVEFEESWEQQIKGGPKWGKEIKVASLVLAIILLGYCGFAFRENIYEFFLNIGSNVKLPFVKEGDDLVAVTRNDLKRISVADKHYNMGLKDSKQGNLDGAISEYKKAIGLRKDYGLYYQELAVAYEQKGDFKRALGALNALLKNDRSGSFAEGAIMHIDKLKRRKDQ